MLLRFLFPSWKFFEDFSEYPSLEFRVHGDSAWRTLPKPPTRKLYHLILNAQGNFHMACNSLIERLLVESQENSEIEKLGSFERVRRMVIYFIQEARPELTDFQFEFRILLHSAKMPTETIISSGIQRS